MKNYFFLLLFCLNINFIFSQGMIKQWDYRYGGTITDVSFCKPILFFDNSMLITTYSNSDSTGNKTKNSIGGTDVWLIKVSPNGIINWEKSIFGNDGDGGFSHILNQDNSVVIGAVSDSKKGYDKSDDNIGLTNFWVIKIDSSGNKVWDVTRGSLHTDALVKIVQSPTGGYVLGGFTLGGIGGDKTEPSWGSWDVWVVGIDSVGNKLWDKRIGGSYFDKLTDMVATSDGGYLLAIQTSSGISGDKTVADHGDYDYWVVKIDSVGNIVWQNTYGGDGQESIYSITRLHDGNFLLGGISTSNTSGTKTQDTKDTSQTDIFRRGDYWLVKIDSVGNQIWDKDYGGVDAENKIGNIEQTLDGGFIITGNSYSNQGGDKTEDNNAKIDAPWLVKTDSNGNIMWDKTIKTQPGWWHDELAFTIQNHDSCYTTVVSTQSDIGGYKTQPNWDTTGQTKDIWIIKHCDTTSNIGYATSHNHQNVLMIYPNPNKGIFWIKTFIDNSISKSMFIYTITGKLIYKKENMIENIVQVDLSSEARGIYFVKVVQQNNVLVGKVVVE